MVGQQETDCFKSFYILENKATYLSELNKLGVECSVQMPSAMENQWTSPKFITCPDCGERYDSNHKRRLIDTCGHPRCYSCLFVDKPCPLCQKLPQAPKSRSSSFHNSVGSDSEESADHVSSSESLEGPEAEQVSQSHPDLGKQHKERAATLPARGFRTDNYFRSLYRYDPHASENTNGKITKERPRSVPSYHKSLENLSEQFWKSVERASSPLGKGARSASPLSKNDESSSSMRSLTDDATSSHARLTVPGHTRRRASTEIAKSSEFAEGGTNLSALRAEVLQKSDVSEGRTRSQSDLIPKKFVEIGFHDNRDTSDAHTDRSGSPSPNHFYHGGFYAGDTDRGRPASDRSSDISLPFSDSWSESSGDSDHVNTSFSQVPKEITKRWSYDENHNERLRVAEERLMQGLMRTNEPGEQRKKITKNPLQNTIHWVIDPPKQNQTEKYHQEEGNLPKRPEPPKRTQSSKMINAQKLQESVEPSRASKSVTAL